jgi:hypothetical protein
MKNSKPTYSELRELLLETAEELYQKGPGWAQEMVVLDEAFKKIGGQYKNDRYDETQQRLLTCWHDLFRNGELSWGWNLENPNWPFFHLPPPDAEREAALKRMPKR